LFAFLSIAELIFLTINFVLRVLRFAFGDGLFNCWIFSDQCCSTYFWKYYKQGTNDQTLSRIYRILLHLIRISPSSPRLSPATTSSALVSYIKCWIREDSYTRLWTEEFLSIPSPTWAWRWWPCHEDRAEKVLGFPFVAE